MEAWCKFQQSSLNESPSVAVGFPAKIKYYWRLRSKHVKTTNPLEICKGSISNSCSETHNATFITLIATQEVTSDSSQSSRPILCNTSPTRTYHNHQWKVVVMAPPKIGDMAKSLEAQKSTNSRRQPHTLNLTWENVFSETLRWHWKTMISCSCSLQQRSSQYE